VLGYPLAMRMRGGYPAIDNSVPSTYIIDRQGVIRFAKAGAFTRQSFAEAIAPLLVEPA
jgi:cytochrome c biogenesis protein CcmG, thiol:disulfide interchange protein DsbE